jgi:hypothetical protein
MRALTDESPVCASRRRGPGAIGDARAINGLLGASKTAAAVRRQAAWAIGVVSR